VIDATLLSRAHDAIRRAHVLGDQHIQLMSRTFEVATAVHLSRATRVAHQRSITRPDDNIERERARLTAEMQSMEERHRDQLANLQKAIESRDIIGQAKGIIIASCRCSADEAFAMLRQQSQHENRKLVDVAREIVEHAQQRG
jgi:hypothetical protein